MILNRVSTCLRGFSLEADHSTAGAQGQGTLGSKSFHVETFGEFEQAIALQSLIFSGVRPRRKKARQRAGLGHSEGEGYSSTSADATFSWPYSALASGEYPKKDTRSSARSATWTV